MPTSAIIPKAMMSIVRMLLSIFALTEPAETLMFSTRDAFVILPKIVIALLIFNAQTHDCDIMIPGIKV